MDNALRKLTGMEKIPSTSTVGDWLRRQGNSLGLNALKKVIDITTRRALSMDKRKEYTLYSDPTIIEAEKYDTKMTYKGTKGYRPIIATLGETPLIVSHSFSVVSTFLCKFFIERQIRMYLAYFCISPAHLHF
jgi:uncharacterized protein (UPF0218 family)